MMSRPSLHSTSSSLQGRRAPGAVADEALLGQVQVSEIIKVLEDGLARVAGLGAFCVQGGAVLDVGSELGVSCRSQTGQGATCTATGVTDSRKATRPFCYRAGHPSSDLFVAPEERGMVYAIPETHLNTNNVRPSPSEDQERPSRCPADNRTSVVRAICVKPTVVHGDRAGLELQSPRCITVKCSQCYRGATLQFTRHSCPTSLLSDLTLDLHEHEIGRDVGKSGLALRDVSFKLRRDAPSHHSESALVPRLDEYRPLPPVLVVTVAESTMGRRENN